MNHTPEPGRVWPPLLAALMFCASVAAAPVEPPPGLADRIQHGIEALAADDMEGRGVGTAGLGKAADWIEQALRSAKLEPAFGSSYRQRFPIKTGVKLLDGNDIEGLTLDDWVPLGFSSSGTFAGDLVFVGYGIAAPPIGFDELAGLDLAGKVVLMLRYEPQERDDDSPFDGRKPSRWSAVRYRVHQARERGAAAVVFVTGPIQDEGKDRLPVLKNDGPESPAGIPVLQVKTSVAQRWLTPAGIDLARFQADVDRDLRPRSRATGVRVLGTIGLEATFADAENVAGIIPGRGPHRDQVVIIGAHYDHLGMGGQGSMRPNVAAIHNGADDNASGTITAISVGELLAKELGKVDDRRTVMVALFAGEEVGLAGSGFFVNDPPVPMERVVAMVNLDMVGRYRKTLAVLGSDTAPEWKAVADRVAADVGLAVTTRGDGYGPSDQTSFYGKGVPVIHLFTGAHDLYHTPDDDANTIDAPATARVAMFAHGVMDELARGTLTPTYKRASSAPLMAGDGRGYGAYLGTIPDYTAMDDEDGGVLLADVRAGGPADVAGVRGKDRIVEMAGTRIENLYDMTYALQDHKPGQTVDVVVERGGERLTLRATLGDRAKMGVAEPGQEEEERKESEELAGEAEEEPAPVEPAAPASQPAAAASQPASPATLPTEHAASPAPAAFEIDPFYEGRPGAEFAIGAGKPFHENFEGEGHLRDVRQLTFGGENAEGYWSPDGKRIIFQATPRGAGCDQQYVMDMATGETVRVSSGKGRTTCGYFDYPEADRILYASTEAASPDCPPPPDRSQGYVWAVYDGYDIYEANPDGSDARRITESPGYDAEATWCHRGGKLVFTSVRDGDLDLYLMDEAGDVTRLTDVLGYDGGAFFSPDCREIVWRASRPRGDEALHYEGLLSIGLVKPSHMEIYVMKVDGRSTRQITANGAANFCPTYLADGQRIIYSSNAGSADGREFDLWLVDKESGATERITTAPGFDGFPHFSPDGRYMVWGSNRADQESHETNLFVARWED